MHSVDIVVIGAGAAGMYIARQFVQKKPHVSIRLLEASTRFGGRIRTMYEEDTTISYESGPWRVPRSHRRTQAFLQAGGARFKAAPTPVPDLAKEYASNAHIGLTTWESNALEFSSPERADKFDLATGYADQTDSAVGSEPYMVSSSTETSAGDAHSATQLFYIVPDGFSKAIDTLSTSIQHVTNLNHRVIDVTFADQQLSARPTGGGRRYSVQVSKRTGHNNFETSSFLADAVFICVPPHISKEWTLVQQHALSLVSAVDPGMLQHIYVKYAKHPRGLHFAHKMLGQVVSSQYENSDWFQISYSSGRLAKMWYHLYLQDDEAMWSRLFKEFGLKKRDVKHNDRRLHTWPVAYHKWKAVPDFSLEDAVQSSIRVNRANLPGMYYAGEAFSSFQAWIEGALETAERAIAAYDSDVHAPKSLTRIVCRSKEVCVTVEGQQLDVTKWSRVHPGGKMALLNHKDEDVTQLMRHIGHSSHAWAIVHSLKK